MRKKPPTAPDLSALLRRLPARDLALLRAAGRLADRAGVGLYLVGGAVRDLLGALPRSRRGAGPDLDLVVDGDGPDFARHLAVLWGGETVVHARFLTATVRRRDGKRVDVAGARRETYPKPAALPVTTPGTLEDDAGRRDFSINAMAVRLNAAGFGRLHDPSGGRADLARRVLRVLHPLSFRDDPTRILRAARYAARLRLRLAAGTERALRAEVRSGGLERLSPARLRHEWERVLAEPDPEPALLRLKVLGVLARLHPRLARGLWPRARWADLGLPAGVRLPAPLDQTVLRALAWLEPLDRAQAQALAGRLGMPGPVRKALEQLKTAGERVRRTLLRRRGLEPDAGAALFRTLSAEVLWVLRAKLPRRHPGRKWIADFLVEWCHVRPRLTGRDLRCLGYAPGPAYAAMLAALRDERLAGRARTRADEEHFLRRTFPVSPTRIS